MGGLMPFLIALFARAGLSQGLSRVLGFVVPLGLAALILGLLWARGTHYEDQRDTARAQVDAVNAKLAVSNASIATLQSSIAEQNAAIDKQSAAYTAAKKQADADQVKLADQAKSSDQQIARFRELAAKKGDGKCEAPAALLDEVGKL